MHAHIRLRPAGFVFGSITYVLLLGAGKDPWQHLKSLIPTRQSLGATYWSE